MGHIVITGANRGIGLALLKQYLSTGKRVSAICRRSSPELDELGTQFSALLTVVTGIYIDRDDCISALKTALKPGQPIDILINNAGVLYRDTFPADETDWNDFRKQYEVNALGPLRVTAALRSRLSEGSKVVIVTSRMGSVADNNSGRMYGYRMSKAAVNAAGKSLSVDLKPAGIPVLLVHPGYVRTGMTGGNGYIDAPEAASGIIERITELSIERSGSFMHANGENLPW